MRNFTFDNEIKIIEHFRDSNYPPLGLPENEENIKIIHSLYKDINWKNWTNNSGKDQLPPDFYNIKEKLMLEVMRIDDHASNEGKANIIKKNENRMLRELQSTGILDNLSPDASVFTLTDSKLSTNEDHNYIKYFDNFKRIVEKHSNQVSNYRKNYPNYKLIFFVFDESSGTYFETPEKSSEIIVKKGMDLIGKLHFYWLDKKFVNIIENSKADYFIWYKPYGYFETREGINDILPKVIIYDLKDMKVEKIKYNSSKMISSEI